tara:strand:- start:7442 stop:7696 length:255 start_codon:yes stop_codon:yes gene_type:complete
MCPFSFDQNPVLLSRYPQGDILLNFLKKSNQYLALRDFKNELNLSHSSSRNIISFLEGKGMIDVVYEDKKIHPCFVYRIRPEFL